MLGRKAQHKDCQTLIKLKQEREELADLIEEGIQEYAEQEKEAVEETGETFEGLIETKKDKEREYVMSNKTRKEVIIYKIIRMIELSKGLHTKTIKDYTTTLDSPYTKKNYTDLMLHLGSNIPMMSDVLIMELAEFISSDQAGEDIDFAYVTAIQKSPKSV